MKNSNTSVNQHNALADKQASGTYPSKDSEHTLLYDVDDFFHGLYTTGLDITDTPDRGEKRRKRFYNLVNILQSTLDLDGEIVECGAWRGLSSYLMNGYLRRESPNYKGEGFHIVDSFQGLSEPTPEDIIDRDITLKGKNRIGVAFKSAGAYAGTLNHIQDVLSEYTDIQYHAGWIPNIFQKLPEHQYKFVHIDLDLYEPTRASMEYFYPRLTPGGAIICDDYGSLFWPGAKLAIDSFCEEHKVRCFALTTGQAVLVKECLQNTPSLLRRLFRSLFRIGPS